MSVRGGAIEKIRGRVNKVMDMFLGGFTTARVGLKLGREPLGFEVNNKSFNHFYPRFHLKSKWEFVI